jgi:S1-C subfamily serine protease
VLNEDDDGRDGGSLPDPSSRHWRHPSEVGLTPTNTDFVDRRLGIAPLAALGTLAFGGTAFVLLFFGFGPFPALTDGGRLTMIEGDLGGQTELSVFNQATGDLASGDSPSGESGSGGAAAAGQAQASTTTLTLPPQTSESSDQLDSFADPDGQVVQTGPQNDDKAGPDSAEALQSTGIFTGKGSGDRLASFLVHDRMVLTSASALDGRSSVWLALDDNWVEAPVVGSDAITDVAVLEPVEWFDALVDAAVRPSEAELSDKVRIDPLVGVLQAGFPSSWSGVVSTVDDMATNAAGLRWYQSLTMSVLSSDSLPGSAVLTESGDAVGMVMSSPETLAAAVPLDLAIDVARSLTAIGSASQAWIGVEAANDKNGDTRIVTVDPASPVAGVLQPGDVVLSVDGSPLLGADHLAFAVRQAGPEADLTLVVRRDGRYYPITITTAIISLEASR